MQLKSIVEYQLRDPACSLDTFKSSVALIQFVIIYDKRHVFPIDYL